MKKEGILTMEQGSLSINSENIFPIIKKWLYSDHDIFFRELVSNGCDAITKLKKLELMGETELDPEEELKLEVIANPTEKTLTFADNGLGMTAEEVKKYINDIAFSGAADFLSRYKDKANEDQIIGHFGLGFYSAFMVASKVTIDTLSYVKGAEPVHWESEGGTVFSMDKGERELRGTSITLYLAEDSTEFANEYRAREVLEKYCSFMPYPIYFTNTDAKPEEPKTVKNEDGTETVQEPEAPKPLNDVTPLWGRNPSECKEEDYKAFYRKLFRDYKDPLFWIHLNMDYPFRLKGILYFPKLNLETEPAEGTIKLFSNQVFIADNIKEVIPEFLLLLKGVIDCPDLPLNVSRSALQNDGFVKKISDYITKKVADKLTGMFKVDRENYEKYWDDIHPFIKYGCLKDSKFSDKVKSAVIYKNLEDKYISLEEYLVPKAKEEDVVEVDPDAPDKLEEEDKRSVIYYITDPVQQATYIRLFKENGLDALLFDHAIDEPFITKLETEYKDYKFCRIDGAVDKALAEELSEEDAKADGEALAELFKKALSLEKLEVKVQKFKDDKVASLMTFAEENRRMNEMFKMYGMDTDSLPNQATLVLNKGNRLVQYLLEQPETEVSSLIALQLYDLARMGQGPLPAESMTAFVERSQEILGRLIP